MIDYKKKYFTEQVITYLGNKRSLLKEIDSMIKIVLKELNKDKIISADLFSGSGVVSRLLKERSSLVISNDLEYYSAIINKCFLTNKIDFQKDEFVKYLNLIYEKMNEEQKEGIVSKHYAPKDDENIKVNERVFYTRENALFIDNFRKYIDEIVPTELKHYFLALLITEASIHVNTSGVFKGFYKDKNTGIGKFGGTDENALKRIKSKIEITLPILSDEESEVKIYSEDAIKLSKKLKNLDLVYLDPPYNQHPYGSNYFMLNIILKNEINDEISKVSGIPRKWNRSPFNNKNDALKSMEKIVSNLDTKYILISYNNEGFITYDEMNSMLSKYGKVKSKKIKYNTFRGSRNLNGRNIYTNEYLFLLKKE